MTALSTPLKGVNAIESATFFLVLNQAIDTATTDAIRQALDQFKEELPGVPAQQLGFVINFMGGIPQPMLPGGVPLSRFVGSPDGSHAWRAEVNGNVVQVTCGQYTGFPEVWERAQRYLYALLNVLPTEFAVAEVGFQVVDKFLYPVGLTADSYDMAELFRSGSPYLTSKSWASGLLWHVFQGWFDDAGSGKMLHQVNIANTNAASVDQRFSAVIDHRIVVRWADSPAPTLRELLHAHGDEMRTLSGLMSRMHRRNVDVIKEVLTQDKLIAIGMVVE